MKRKKIFIIIIIFFFLFNISNGNEVIIKVKIDNEIITNVDIINEKKLPYIFKSRFNRINNR